MPTDTIRRRLGNISPYVVGDLDLSPPGFEDEGERLLARTWQLLRGVRRWLALEAVVASALGIALLALSGLSSTTLLYVIAAWALTTGALKLNAARRLPLSGGRELLLHWSGIVSIVFGLVMFVEPSGGALALLGWIAIFAIVTGMTRLVLALELRSLSRSTAR